MTLTEKIKQFMYYQFDFVYTRFCAHFAVTRVAPGPISAGSMGCFRSALVASQWQHRV